jgi:hypothetical protein
VTTVDGPTKNPALSQAALANVNRFGVVGGTYVDDQGNSRAAVYDLHEAEWLALPVIPATGYSAAGGVNDWGLVVGNCTTDPAVLVGNQGWLYDSFFDMYEFFDVPGADKVTNLGTIVNDVNDDGVVVGFFTDKQGAIHGFIRWGRRYKTVDIPCALNTEVFSINNRGDIAGRYLVGDIRHGFILRADGTLVTIDVPGAISTWVTAVSDNGNVAGYYETTDGNYHGWYKLHGDD